MRGKKYFPLFTALLVLRAFCAPPVLPAQDLTVPQANYLFSGIYDSPLYPELDYHTHPSILGTLPGKFITFSTNLDYASSKVTDTRVDANVGAAGGTSEEQSDEFFGDFQGGFYFPQKNGSLGFRAGGFFDYHGIHGENEQFDDPSERLTEETEYTPFGLNFSALKTLRSRIFKVTLDQGYELGYDLSYTPAWFTWVTDKSQSPSLVYVRDKTGGDKDTYSHTIKARADVGSVFGPVELKFALAYSFNYINADKQYRGVDNDGDTYADELAAYEDWAGKTPENGGPAEELTGFDQIDRTFGNRLSLDLYGKAALLKSLDLLFTLGYIPLDLVKRDYYQRMPTALHGDDSSNTETFASDGGEFSAGLGAKFKDQKRGLVYSLMFAYQRRGIVLTLEGTQALGYNKFNSRNSGHYFEAALGLDPAVGDIVNSGALPSNSVSQGFGADAGLEWNPRPGMILLFSLGLTASWLDETYVVFNTDTLTVWTEEVRQYGVEWDLTPRFGITLPLGEKVSLTSQITLLDIAGLAHGDSGDSPYNVTLNQGTANGAYNSTENNAASFSIDLGLVVSF